MAGRPEIDIGVGVKNNQEVFIKLLTRVYYEASHYQGDKIRKFIKSELQRSKLKYTKQSLCPTAIPVIHNHMSGGWKILEEAFLQKTDIICLPPLPPPLLWMHLRPLCPKGRDDSSQVFPLPPQLHCPRANRRSE
ncbi:Headcase Protein [Manis pentadactyla]|nr:Headcase Protein [Manis pentadactyla]